MQSLPSNIKEQILREITQSPPSPIKSPDFQRQSPSYATPKQRSRVHMKIPMPPMSSMSEQSVEPYSDNLAQSKHNGKVDLEETLPIASPDTAFSEKHVETPSSRSTKITRKKSRKVFIQDGSSQCLPDS